MLGLNVQRLRRGKGLSQEQLSFAAGRTRAYISSVEAGRQNATLDTLAALAKALDVEPKDLITATAPKRHTGRSTKQPARGSRD